MDKSSNILNTCHQAETHVQGGNANVVMHSSSNHDIQMTGSNSIEDTSLVEGRDYDVIHLYIVNPDVYDLPDSSDDDTKTADYECSEKDVETECMSGSNTISQNGQNSNFDTPPDEYFINNEQILDTDDPVVKDVDEYFIKTKCKEMTPVPTLFHSGLKKDIIEEKTEIQNGQDTTDNVDMLKIEELKKYLLGNMTYEEFRHTQKSCSLPQPPVSLDLDFYNFAFDYDKDKSENVNKSDDIPPTPNNKDANNFIKINNQKEPKSVAEEDDFSLIDMEIEPSLEVFIESAPPITDLPSPKRTSIQTHERNVFDFCIQKTPGHNYCLSKKRHSLHNLKGEQSLRKPEMYLNQRHRTCKSKKVVYHFSSDDESVNTAKTKKVTKTDTKKKINIKPSVKLPSQSNYRKKLSPPHSAPDSCKDSVFIKSASTASDNRCQNSNGSIKITIKNKSKVVLNFEHVDSQKDKNSHVEEPVVEKIIAPEEAEKHENRHKLKSLQIKSIHGDNKTIIHLGKHRSKPVFSSMVIQTDPVAVFAEIPILPEKRAGPASRKRSDSEISRHEKQTKPEYRVSKLKEVRIERTETKEKRSKSKDSYDSKYIKQSKCLSRSRRRLSRSRSRSRSRTRYSRYRRSDSSYRKRRSPSIRRDRSNRSNSRSRPTENHSNSLVAKKMKTTHHTNGNDRKITKSVNPPLRKPTVLKSSDSCSSKPSCSFSSSSGSSSSSNSSKRDEMRRKGIGVIDMIDGLLAKYTEKHLPRASAGSATASPKRR